MSRIRGTGAKECKVSLLTESEIQALIDAAMPQPYLVGQPIAVFSKTLGDNLITSFDNWEWLRGDLWGGGTIGNSASGATLADNRLQNLYLQWGGIQANWDAGTAIAFPTLKKSFLLVAGEGKAIGEVGGEEFHRLTEPEMPEHVHPHKEGGRYTSPAGGTLGWFGLRNENDGNFLTEPAGGSQPHNNMPPYCALPFLIFLGVSS